MGARGCSRRYRRGPQYCAVPGQPSKSRSRASVGEVASRGWGAHHHQRPMSLLSTCLRYARRSPPSRRRTAPLVASEHHRREGGAHSATWSPKCAALRGAHSAHGAHTRHALTVVWSQRERCELCEHPVRSDHCEHRGHLMESERCDWCEYLVRGVPSRRRNSVISVSGVSTLSISRDDDAVAVGSNLIEAGAL